MKGRSDMPKMTPKQVRYAMMLDHFGLHRSAENVLKSSRKRLTPKQKSDTKKFARAFVRFLLTDDNLETFVRHMKRRAAKRLKGR